jgi:hypothetical protein
VLTSVCAEHLKRVWGQRPQPTQVHPGWAIVGIAATFLIAYGVAAATAFDLYFSSTASAAWATASYSEVRGGFHQELALLVSATLVGGFVILATMPRGLPLRDFHRKVPGDRGGAALSAAGVLVALLAGFLLVGVVLGITSMNTATPVGETLRQGIGFAVLAGAGEEIYVLALPYAALRLVRLPARWGDGEHPRVLPLWVVVTVCLVLRMSYHVYYGAGALALLPWALVTVLIFHRWHLLFPLILTHIAYDTVLTVNNHGVITNSEKLAVIITATAVLLTVGVQRRRTGNLDTSHAQIVERAPQT